MKKHLSAGFRFSHQSYWEPATAVERGLSEGVQDETEQRSFFRFFAAKHATVLFEVRELFISANLCSAVNLSLF